MIMNLVANTQSLINTMNAITAASATCDLNSILQSSGKIFRYLTQFQSVAAASQFSESSYDERILNFIQSSLIGKAIINTF
jgi:hypothetical protein